MKLALETRLLVVLDYHGFEGKLATELTTITVADFIKFFDEDDSLYYDWEADKCKILRYAPDTNQYMTLKSCLDKFDNDLLHYSMWTWELLVD